MKFELTDRIFSKTEEKDSKVKKEKFVSFIDVLKDNIQEYTGLHAEILAYAPDFFHLIVSLYKENIPSPHRQMINSVISYFVLPDDLLPEDELGVFGYLEDLYLSAYVIQHLEKEDDLKILVEKKWTRDEDVFQTARLIIDELEKTSDPSVNEAVSQVVSFTGIEFLEAQLADQDQDAIEGKKSSRSVNRQEELKAIDDAIRESSTISKELHQEFFKSQDEHPSQEKERTVTEDTDLLQNTIPVYILFHLTKKAKDNNLLSSFQRKALFDLVNKKHKKFELSDKQIKFLEDLIKKGIQQGIVEAPCEDEPCDKCDELREIMSEIEIGDTS